MQNIFITYNEQLGLVLEQREPPIDAANERVVFDQVPESRMSVVFYGFPELENTFEIDLAGHGGLLDDSCGVGVPVRTFFWVRPFCRTLPFQELLQLLLLEILKII